MTMEQWAWLGLLGVCISPMGFGLAYSLRQIANEKRARRAHARALRRASEVLR